MKKNNTLFKTIAFFFLIFSILSWIIPGAKASGAEITSLGVSRVSLYNIIEYPYLTLKYFIEPILYILAVGGMYDLFIVAYRPLNIQQSLTLSELLYSVS